MSEKENAIVAFAGTAMMSPDDIAAVDAKMRRQQADHRPHQGDVQYLKMLRDGDWVFGKEDTEPEEDALFVVLPGTMRHGWGLWDGGSRRDLMLPITEEMPACPQLPDHLVGKKDPFGGDVEWKKTVGFDMVCICGEDKDQKFSWDKDSKGANDAFNLLMADYLDRPEVEFCLPIIRLESDHYTRKGTKEKTFFPVFNVAGWGHPDGRAITEDEQLLEIVASIAETPKVANDDEEAPEAETGKSDPAPEAETEEQPKRRKRSRKAA